MAKDIIGYNSIRDDILTLTGVRKPKKKQLKIKLDYKVLTVAATGFLLGIITGNILNDRTVQQTKNRLEAQITKKTQEVREAKQALQKQAIDYQSKIAAMSQTIEVLSNKVASLTTETERLIVKKVDGSSVEKVRTRTRRKVENNNKKSVFKKEKLVASATLAENARYLSDFKDIYGLDWAKKTTIETTKVPVVVPEPKKLVLYAGLTRDLNPILGGAYNVMGPLIVGGSIGLFGIGQHLAINVGVMF